MKHLEKEKLNLNELTEELDRQTIIKKMKRCENCRKKIPDAIYKQFSGLCLECYDDISAQCIITEIKSFGGILA